MIQSHADRQQHCLPGFVSEATGCNCGMNCVKCTLEKHCSPGDLSVTANIQGTECVCTPPATTKSATTKPPASTTQPGGTTEPPGQGTTKPPGQSTTKPPGQTTKP